MKIIHISDIHLTIPGQKIAELDPHDRFAQALADVAQNHPDAERVIITGDLTHWGEEEAYEALKSALSGFAVPVRLMIGNHDDRQVFCNVFRDHPVDANGFVNHAETIDGVRFLYLDSVGTRTHAGHFCALRRAWLRSELQQSNRARIFIHHNPMEVGLPAEDKIALVPADRAEFRALLEEFADRIDYVHFGHVHAPIHGRYAGVQFASAPSTGNQSLPRLTETELLHGAPMEPSYFVMLINGEDTIIHQVPFNWSGPVFTAGTEWEGWAKPDVAIP